MLHLEIFVLKTTDNTIIVLNPFVFCNKQSSVPPGSWGHPQALVSSTLAPPHPSLGPSVPAPTMGCHLKPCHSCALLGLPPRGAPIGQCAAQPWPSPSPGRLSCSLAGLAEWAPAARSCPACSGEPLQPLAPLQVGHSSLTPTFTFSTMYTKQRESEKMWLMLLPWEKNTFCSLSPTAVVSCEHLEPEPYLDEDK